LASSTAKPVFVITGTSGEGKSTLAKALVERIPELELAVSATTRPRRPGEEDGRDYWFLEAEEFDRRLEAGELLEWVELPRGEG
jgi:guanylate kinase